MRNELDEFGVEVSFINCWRTAVRELPAMSW